MKKSNERPSNDKPNVAKRASLRLKRTLSKGKDVSEVLKKNISIFFWKLIFLFFQTRLKKNQRNRKRKRVQNKKKRNLKETNNGINNYEKKYFL